MSNFTPAQTATMQKRAPINLEIAKELAGTFGVSHRAVISKAVMLKIYSAQPKRAASISKPTKADIIQDIEERMRLPHGALGSLNKVADLRLLLTSTLSLEELS
jgi:hypothetical protein